MGLRKVLEKPDEAQLLLADFADPAFRRFNFAVLNAGERLTQTTADFAHLIHAGRQNDVAFMRMNEADRGDDGSRAAEAAFLHVLDFVEAHLAFNHVQTEVVLGHINERAAGDGGQNRRALRNDQVVVLIDEENIGAARLFNVSTRLRIQVEVFSIAGAVCIHVGCRLMA